MRPMGASRPSRRRGVLLVELIAYLAIMAAVALIVGNLMVLIFKSNAAAVSRDVMIHRVDTALDVLRRDAWQAASMQVQGNQARLQTPDGPVVWLMGENHTLLRKVPSFGGLAGTRTWRDMPEFEFSAIGSVLKVGVRSGPGGSSTREEVMLVSQRMLAGGE